MKNCWYPKDKEERRLELLMLWIGEGDKALSKSVSSPDRWLRAGVFAIKIHSIISLRQKRKGLRSVKQRKQEM